MRSKEIGSEFIDIPTKKEENLLFCDETKWFLSGRSALEFIILDILKKKGMFSVALPSYCCESMILPFEKHQIPITFYPVVIENHRLIKKIENIQTDVLLDMDYFGYLQKESYDFEGIIIQDVTHSFFASYPNADYLIGSLRKWAGFKTGGFAYAKNGFIVEDYCDQNIAYIEKRKTAMLQKKQYLEGSMNNKNYLEIFREAEEELDHCGICVSDKEDIDAARHLDIQTLKEKRQENAKYLISELKDLVLFDEMQENDIPLFVPILVEHREALRKKLIENDIYCPIHWPLNEKYQFSTEELEIYQRELSLVCDQRYDLEDMREIVKIVKEFQKEC